MTDIVIREARPDDAPHIIEFQLAMALETEELTLDREILTRGVAAVFDHPSLGRYFVAESEGRVIASLMITYEWSDWRNGVVWWLQSVYVDESYRRQGVFRKMYDHIIEKISKDPGVIGLRLYVDRLNVRAQSVSDRGQHRGRTRTAARP